MKEAQIMKEYDIRSIVGKGEIASELDYERAKMALRRLRLALEEEPSLKSTYDQLFDLIHRYEATHWLDMNGITEAKVQENDLAEAQVGIEQAFMMRRRSLILEKMEALSLKQKDLALLLRHNKSYTSELINGIRAFSTYDLIILHNLLHIDLKDLFFTAIPLDSQSHIRSSIEKIGGLKIQQKNLTMRLLRK
jgi:hypothetical protein